MDTVNKTMNIVNEPEVYRCVTVNTNHMKYKDAEILLYLSDGTDGIECSWHWIHQTSDGFLIRLTMRPNPVAWLKAQKLSDDFCDILTFLTEKSRASMVHFDQNGAVINGFPVHDF